MDETPKQGADHSRRGHRLALVVASLIVLAGAIAGAVIVPRLPPREATTSGHSPMRGGHNPRSRTASALASEKPPFLRGICWEAAGRIDSTALDPIVRVRANWISQTPFGWQPGLDSPRIRGSYGAPRRWGGHWGESDEGIIATARWAHARGVHVLLKPHIWTRGGWSGSIAMKSEEDWATWFRDYRAFILHYADLAERCGVEALAVGTELGAAMKRDKEWRSIIADVRGRYKGSLVYCANWADDLHHIRFWDALDWIGVQAYYPLSEKREPTTEDLVRGWSRPLSELDALGRVWGKPVVLTEVGYHSLDTAAIRPWEWELEGNLSVETQARCYEALFLALADHPGVNGVFIWKWHPEHARAGGPGDTEYSPQRKPAEAVLARAFAWIERTSL